LGDITRFIKPEEPVEVFLAFLVGSTGFCCCLDFGVV
jgi:hypothetical protein